MARAVKRPGCRATFLLAAFLASAVPGRAAEAIRTLPAAGIGVESAALLLSGQEGGEIPVGVLALAAPGKAGETRILLRLRIDGQALLADQKADALRTEVSLYVMDAEGGVQGSLLETVEIDLGALRKAVDRSGFDFLGALDLRPGTYSLRMLARNLETGRLGVRALNLPVPDPATLEDPGLSAPPEVDPRPTARASSLGSLDPPLFPDDAPLPPQVGAGPAAEAEGPRPSPIPDTAAGRQLRSAARGAYRAALGQLAAGSEAAALAAVAAFEDPLFHRAQAPVQVEQLVEIEAGAALELAAIDPESLVPLLRLHQLLYEQGTARQRHPGSSLAREVFLRLVSRYRERGQAELARRFASVFGITLLRTGIRTQGEQLLRQAQAEDPGNEMALLELAADAERRGEHAEALGHLEALLRAQPGHPEARIRRALDLVRLGRKTEAVGELRQLIESETGGWRLSLAYQELARLYLAERAVSRAEGLLRKGLERMPGDEKLTLLQAAVLERAGLAAAARRLIADLKPEGSEGGGTARRRYNLAPREPLATVAAGLGPEAAARLPNLAAALEKTAP